MSHQKHVIACAAMLVSGVTMPDTVLGQSLSPPYQSYSAKFSCGPRAADNDVVRGTYATSINIHNPQSQLNVVFFKKVVIANEEGATRAASSLSTPTKYCPRTLRNRSTARSFTRPRRERRPRISKGSS